MSMVEMVQGVVGTQFVEPIKEKYEAQVKELNEKAIEIASKGHKDEFSYVVVGLSKLTSMMLDCEQYDLDIDPSGEAILTDRVIKINRFIKSEYFDLHGIDHVVIGGMFCVAPVYLLPANKVEKSSRYSNYLSIMNPTEHGLPSEEECNYSTIKQLTNDVYIAIAKFNNNYINEIVNSVRNYEYVFLR